MKEFIHEFDGVSDIVYVSSMVDDTVLFLNKVGLQDFGYDREEQVIGRKCYDVFHGKEEPCSFCIGGKLQCRKYEEWECDNVITGRKYYIKEKLIDWDGEPARICIARPKREGYEKSEGEEIVMECIRMLHSSVETDVAIQNALMILGRSLRSERTYIFQIRGQHMDNTYEWCEEGVTQEKESLQNLPLSTIDRWLPYFSRNDCVIIEDIEMIKEEAEEEYAILKRQDIRKLITVPLLERGRLVGYFGVDNPHARNFGEISNMMKMLAYFLQSLLQRKKREDYLEKLGFTDGLTGALNRNAFVRDTTQDTSKEVLSAGGFYIDINGLKKMNDTYGHEAGDNLIRKVYQIVSAIAEEFPVYRLGGDEFAVLCLNISKKDLEEMNQKLWKELDGRNGCSAAVGCSFLDNPDDLGVLLDEADKRMYRNKQQYYKSRSDS